MQKRLIHKTKLKNFVRMWTYLTLFQQERLEHWVQIAEVQASTERKVQENINHWCRKLKKFRKKGPTT